MINELPDYLEVPQDYIPEFLTSEERLVWLRAMPQLIREGILTTLDLNLAEMYCVMTVKLNELLKENPSHYMVDKYRNHIKKHGAGFMPHPCLLCLLGQDPTEYKGQEGTTGKEGKGNYRFSSGRQTTCPAEILQTIAD